MQLDKIYIFTIAPFQPNTQRLSGYLKYIHFGVILQASDLKSTHTMKRSCLLIAVLNVIPAISCMESCMMFYDNKEVQRFYHNPFLQQDLLQ